MIFYLPNKLKILRTKPENVQRNLKNPLNNIYKTNNTLRTNHEYILKATSKYNLMTEGLGMITIKGKFVIKNKQVYIFYHPALSVTPGQFAVLYQKNVCLGGGIVNKLIK